MDSPPMFDPDDLPLTTAEGRRPSSTAGDRMMVGLAALALFGGALIAIGKVLPQAEAPQTSDATATAEPTAEASRTPRPTPTPPPLRSFQIEPGTPPQIQLQQPRYGGWVRALEDVTVRGAASLDAIEMGVLHVGDAAWVDELPEDQGGTRGWFQMQIPISGWVPAEVAGREVLRLYQWPQEYGGWIEGLVAGPDGFAAGGYGRGTAGAVAEHVLAASTDGRTWITRSASFMSNYYGLQLASGPAGWLAMSYADDAAGATTPWIWHSADLRDWVPLGSLRDQAALDGGFGQLVANESGYVLMTNGGGRGYGSQGPSLWFSTDGVLWSERRPPEPLPGDYSVHLTVTPLGFYAYGPFEGGPWDDRLSFGAYSPDGWSWSTVAAEEMGSVVGVAAAGENLVAIERADGGRARPWLGTITGDELAWSLDRGSGSAFDGAVVTTMVSDGDMPVAFGWERGTDVALWWDRTDGDWHRHRLPQAYHGLPRMASGGPAGYILVESRPSPLGDNPVLWSLTGSGSWQPAASQVIEPVRASPTESDCAALGTDIIDLMRQARVRAACFGDTAVRVRAYAQSCEGCSYTYGGTSEPAWLVQPNDANTLYLSPVLGESWEHFNAVLAPGLDLDPTWLGNLLDVTGHFDDPASASCRLEPLPEEESWYAGRESIINECRYRFVVTKVRIVRDQE